MKEIRAIELFSGYPDADLLPLPDPMPNELLTTYVGWHPEAEGKLGDLLFSFLLSELLECDRLEAIRRLRVAIDDLESVLNSLEYASD